MKKRITVSFNIPSDLLTQATQHHSAESARIQKLSEVNRLVSIISAMQDTPATESRHITRTLLRRLVCNIPLESYSLEALCKAESILLKWIKAGSSAGVEVTSQPRRSADTVRKSVNSLIDRYTLTFDDPKAAHKDMLHTLATNINARSLSFWSVSDLRLAETFMKRRIGERRNTLAARKRKLDRIKSA